MRTSAEATSKRVGTWVFPPTVARRPAARRCNLHKHIAKETSPLFLSRLVSTGPRPRRGFPMPSANTIHATRETGSELALRLPHPPSYASPSGSLPGEPMFQASGSSLGTKRSYFDDRARPTRLRSHCLLLPPREPPERALEASAFSRSVGAAPRSLGVTTPWSTCS